ncbi:hypothetical protein HAX54_000249 [Datura stramonium]|uniref:Uncharacterized protein n=1 Tax=Datura stramonium TaxID=4076 RepID=A0ABS8T0S8_DATST|nr:hypothetical protein [Datura stramonium]
MVAPQMSLCLVRSRHRASSGQPRPHGPHGHSSNVRPSYPSLLKVEKFATPIPNLKLVLQLAEVKVIQQSKQVTLNPIVNSDMLRLEIMKRRSKKWNLEREEKFSEEIRNEAEIDDISKVRRQRDSSENRVQEPIVAAVNGRVPEDEESRDYKERKERAFAKRKEQNDYKKLATYPHSGKSVPSLRPNCAVERDLSTSTSRIGGDSIQPQSVLVPAAMPQEPPVVLVVQ